MALYPALLSSDSTLEGFDLDGAYPATSCKRPSEDMDVSSSFAPLPKRVFRQATTFSVSSASETGSTQFAASPGLSGSVKREGEREARYTEPAQVVPALSILPAVHNTIDQSLPAPLEEDLVYTEYESIRKPKDSRQTYFTFPGKPAVTIAVCVANQS